MHQRGPQIRPPVRGTLVLLYPTASYDPSTPERHQTAPQDHLSDAHILPTHSATAPHPPPPHSRYISLEPPLNRRPAPSSSLVHTKTNYYEYTVRAKNQAGNGP